MLNEREQRLLEPLDGLQVAMESRLRDWVGISSCSKDPSGVNRLGDAVGDVLRALGFRIAEVVTGTTGRTLVARRDGRPTHRLLLLGHLDTVHPATSSFRDYISAAEGSDVATGPGIADMKGGLVVLVTALELLDKADLLKDRHLTLVLNSDEEIGSPGSQEIIRAEAMESDLCLGFEPGRPSGDGGSTFVNARSGFGRMTVAAKGRAAHSGVDPGAGASAILDLAQKVVALHKLSDAERRIQVSVGTIQGGTAANVIPESASMELDYRFPDDDAKVELEDEIAHLVGRTELRDEKDRPMVVTQVRDHITRPAMIPSEASERMVGRIIAAGQDLGLKLVAERRGGSSDAALAADAGCPSLCGLGAVGGGFHTDQEWIQLSSLKSRTALAALTVMRFFGG